MWATVGHERAVNTLKRSLHEQRLAHAYLMVGPPNVGKMTLALDLARLVSCVGPSTTSDTAAVPVRRDATSESSISDVISGAEPCGECNQCRRVVDGLHADVRIVSVDRQGDGDGRSRVAISIDQVRDIQREAVLKPYEGRYRLFIVDGAERLSEEAANSLLKVLEEPPDQVILVLLTSEPGGLLPTIVSRCQRLELRPLGLKLVTGELTARFDADDETAMEIARLSGGRLGWAIRALSEPDFLEERAGRMVAIEDAVQGGLEERFSCAADLAFLFGENRQSARQALALWLEWWRDVMLVTEGVPELAANLSRMQTLRAVAGALSPAQAAAAVQAVQATLDHLERNANPRLALEELMLVLPRL